MLGAKYEYHLMCWGGVFNDNWIERDLGITGRDFWFDNKQDRQEFKEKLDAVASNRKQIIVFAEHEGEDVRLKTIARMVFTLPDGRHIKYEYDFGYGYEIESAHYMFEDGNYACDCNRSLFLSREHDYIEELECGDDIVMTDFVVTKEAPNPLLCGDEPQARNPAVRRATACCYKPIRRMILKKLEWQPIETIPNEIFVDVWVVSKNSPEWGIRLCNVSKNKNHSSGWVGIEKQYLTDDIYPVMWIYVGRPEGL